MSRQVSRGSAGEYQQIKQKFKETYPDFTRGDEPLSPYFDIWEYGIEIATKELEEKISVLLSCKNCPENKGSLICQKEYENKCLSQKIQFIKELQEENAELKAVERMALYSKMSDQLTKAKEHIENLLYYVKQCTCERSNYAEIKKDIKEAEQFLNSEVEK